MSIDFARREVERHQKEIARLQHEKSREAATAADESKRASSASESAARASQPSTARSKVRDAQRHQDAAVRHQQRVANIESKIAREQGHLNDSLRRLSSAQADQDRRRVREYKLTERKQERQMAAIVGTLTLHEHLHRVASQAIERLRDLPAEITVLFLAANPLDQPAMRLDEEVRSIGEMIRKSKHRDSVRLESRWAVRPLDVLQAINECRPRIVHFSGHGSDRDEIVFQDDEGQTKLVSKEAIVQTMAAGSAEIQLVFFNTCYSRGQAEAVVRHVPAAIGMNAAIGDKAARVFSAQFYSAIGFGLSIGVAFQQAKAALMLEGIAEHSTPELFVTSGLSPEQLILVRPQGGHHAEKTSTDAI